ncbi:MAG: hypothetical protein MAG451_02780 [Anaerolineales bacterium]|nr:hypothetical protein [Anaerolineales bacterium]
MTIVVLAIVLAIIGVLTGWLAPMVVKRQRPWRPYGMGGDIIVSLLIMLVFGLIELQWIMPLFNFPNWFDIAAAIGDPFVLALIVLWLMRKIKPEMPA